MAIITPGKAGGYAGTGSIVPGGDASVPTYGTPPAVTTPTTTPGYFSSEQGATIVNNAQQTQARITPPPPPPPTTTTTPNDKTTAPSSSLTLVNPTTDQKVTFNDASLNKDNINGYLGSGYQLADGSNPPSWMSPDKTTTNATTGNSQIDTATGELDQDKATLAAAQDKLTNFDVSQDPRLQSILSGISSTWDARISDMEQINKSREANVNTTNIRLGSRYTGGAGGVAGSILSDEERQGISRVGELQASKQQALTEAQSAFENQEWTRYAKLVDVAQKNYSDQLDAVSALNKAAQDQSQKLNDQARIGSLSTAVAGLMKQGVTDPKDILDYINSYQDGTDTGANLSATELKSMMDTFISPDAKGIGDIVTSIGKNGAPSDVIDAVSGAGTLADAVKAAGNYLQDVPTSGIVGEYLFAKKQGYSGSFDQYQNEDANRKQKVASAAQDPNRVLSATEAAALDVPFGTTAAQAYGKSATKPPTEAQSNAATYATRMDSASQTIDQLASTISSYNSVQFGAEVAAEPTAVGNAFVSDTIRQLRQAERNFVTSILRRESGASISPSEFATAEKTYFPRPGDDQKTLNQKAKARVDALHGMIQSAGPAFSAETSVPSVAQSAQQGEDAAKTSIIDYGSKNPQLQDTIKKMVGDGKSYSEIKQILGIQ